ncbi:hypothetical protein [Clostridium sp. BJN0001]|uniref:hypothetical protein n=1 Tax=Clostridium sp. BJN0001 TaxID=2930219 RepID=UPI001FD5EF39|nr:hypothetical protein [Clostridium sp. BJN0001]
MELKYYNKNPNIIYDNLIKNNIKPIKITSDLKIGENIAQNITITLQDNVETSLIHNIVKNIDKELKPQPTEKETLLKEVADLKLDSIKKDSIISNALKTVADLKVKIISMEEGK